MKTYSEDDNQFNRKTETKRNRVTRKNENRYIDRQIKHEVKIRKIRIKKAEIEDKKEAKIRESAPERNKDKC